MGASIIDTLCRDIRDYLNAAPGGTFSSPFDGNWTAEFYQLPTFEKRELADLKVIVSNDPNVAYTYEESLVDRCCDNPWRRQVYIAVMKNVVSSDDNDVALAQDVEDLKALVEEISAYLTGVAFPNGGTQNVQQAMAMSPLYDAELLRGDRVFRSFIQLEYI